MSITDEREKHEHPSYGMVSLTRSYSGGKHKFFGSELEVDHWVNLEICTGVMYRELSRDWFSSDKHLIKVSLTPLQFSELITNMNYGNGMPCTIDYFNGKSIEPEIAPETKKDATHRQFKKRMKEFAIQLVETRDKAKNLVKKKTLSKEDQHQLNLHLEWLTQEISGNIPFFMECFQEVADKVVAEAKSEIEAAILHKVTTLGIEKLHEQNKLLNDAK